MKIALAQINPTIGDFEHNRHQAPPGLRVTSRSFGTERGYPLAWKGHDLGECLFGGEFKVTISIGCASYLEYKDKDELFKKAHEALYLAKRNGRNRIEPELFP